MNDLESERGTVLAQAVFAVAVAFSAFQIYMSAYSPLPSIVIRSVHVGFLLLIAFLTTPRGPGAGGRIGWDGWLLGAAAFTASLYHWIFQTDLILRSGDPSTADLLVGSLMVVLVFEAARRLMGLALPLICAFFLLYILLGHLMPRPLGHRGYGFDQVVDHMYVGTEGIFGVPIFVSSTYIFLFILFGAFLERAGIIQLFSDLALGTVGHARGGPAKVAVFSSALMGTVNGSGVANVVTTGQFTIPLMKRFGYKPEFAGAVEATASMGGQIMPPVMGAVAFIMAETLGISYAEVVTAAVIPAILYFVSVYWMVHLEAGRQQLLGLPKAECPNAWAALKRRWPLLLPLAGLVYLLFAGFTPLFAGTAGLGLTAMIVLGLPIAANLGPYALRVVFWIALGLLAGTFFAFGVTAIFAVIALLVAANAVIKGGRQTLRMALASLADGAKNAVPVGIACALVGTIVGTMTMTGLATQVGQWVLALAGDSLFLGLVMTMVMSLILGMGVPTIPNYIITSSLVGPILLGMGVPLVISHMFVFYFGIMADLTPPVALAAFAAASIAKTSGLRIGLVCMRIAVAGFVIPFMAVYTPSLMLQEGGPIAAAYGYPVEVAYIVVKALLAIGLWGAATIGYLMTRMTWWERVAAALAAGLLIAAIPITDEIGFLLGAVVIGAHLWRARRRPAVP